tara:strand:+ start:8930 stop:9790 length:861 start_codon:yes stop_codon:yes gene_type:complete
MNIDENENTFIHNIIEDFQQDLSGNPRMLLLNNLINIIQGNRLNENVSMLPLASNIVLPQQTNVRSLLQQSLFEKNLYKNVLSEKGEKEIQKINYNKSQVDQHSCCISFEDFKEGEEVYKLPCGHIFSDSIFTWLKEESNKCPVCRHELSSKEIKNEDYVLDTSNNTNPINRQIPVNPFEQFLDNMRNVYNNPRPLYRQNATDNLAPIFHRTPFSANLRNTIQEFEYDREYQNAILASIQEFEENTDTINSLEHENDIYSLPDAFDEILLENISSDSDNEPMNQVD